MSEICVQNPGSQEPCEKPVTVPSGRTRKDWGPSAEVCCEHMMPWNFTIVHLSLCAGTKPYTPQLTWQLQVVPFTVSNPELQPNYINSSSAATSSNEVSLTSAACQAQGVPRDGLRLVETISPVVLAHFCTTPCVKPTPILRLASSPYPNEASAASHPQNPIQDIFFLPLHPCDGGGPAPVVAKPRHPEHPPQSD